MSPPHDAALDLQTAADELGVHYQTAYRWVRGGQLPARLVGGKYMIDRGEVEQFATRRSAPASSRPPGDRRLERQAQRVHEALVSGDEVTVRTICRSLVGDGLDVIRLIQEVLVPPLRWIGQAWHDGDLTIWVEHRASAIVERTLGDLMPNPRGRRRGTAMVAAVTGDRHSLPTTMATVALRSANWSVHQLGADMPGAEIVQFCTEHDVDLAVISLTNPDVAADARSVADDIRATGRPVILGGPGRSLADLVDEARSAVASP